MQTLLTYKKGRNPSPKRNPCIVINNEWCRIVEMIFKTKLTVGHLVVTDGGQGHCCRSPKEASCESNKVLTDEA